MLSNAESYFNALHPAPSRVMGVWLPPLTVGQICLLHHEKSPFLYGTPGLGDLATAFLIFQRTTPQAKRMLASRWMPMRLWIQAMRWRKRDFQEGIAQFTAHLTKNHELPNYIQSADKQGRSMGSPHLALLRLVHMRNYGRNDAQVDELSLLRANWEAFALMEYEGQIELANGNIETMLSDGDSNITFTPFAPAEIPSPGAPGTPAPIPAPPSDPSDSSDKSDLSDKSDSAANQAPSTKHQEPTPCK